MMSYTKKRNHRKVLLIGVMAIGLALITAGTSYLLTQNHDSADTPVSTDNVTIPVISLPTPEEKAKRPYQVEAAIVLDYYDGNESEIPSMTKFEGTYRPNQGIDYANNNEEFDVLAIFSGEVIEVKEDPLFGHSCTIQSGDLKITYQSLKDVRFQVKDQVKQGDALSTASANIYNKDLGNHVHIVTALNDRMIDPESIYGKSLAELK